MASHNERKNNKRKRIQQLTDPCEQYAKVYTKRTIAGSLRKIKTSARPTGRANLNEARRGQKQYKWNVEK